MAFKRVGSTAGRLQRETHRTLDACALAALTAIRDQQERLKQFSMSVQSGARKVAWLWVEKRWDETPGEFAFGQLLDLARPIAKYWWRGHPRQVTVRAVGGDFLMRSTVVGGFRRSRCQARFR